MINQLIQIIGDEAVLFEEFLGLLDRQKEALVANDVEELDRVTELQRRKLSESQKLNRRREELIAAIKEVNAIEGDINVTRLLAYADEDQSKRLVRLQQAIFSLNDKITEARNTNAMLLNRSREFISRTMNALARLSRPENTYARPGALERDGGSLAVDRRV